MYIYIYIHTYRERERKRDTIIVAGRWPARPAGDDRREARFRQHGRAEGLDRQRYYSFYLCTYISVYIYIYIYIHTHTHIHIPTHTNKGCSCSRYRCSRCRYRLVDCRCSCHVLHAMYHVPCAAYYLLRAADCGPRTMCNVGIDTMNTPWNDNNEGRCGVVVKVGEERTVVQEEVGVEGA